jgi:GT2 family glycosyltransferase
VFAPLVSLTETLIDDRAVYARGSWAHRVFMALDRLTCGVADCVVADTDAHREYFARRLGVDADKLITCHLGADNAAFASTAASEDEVPSAASAAKVEVLYFGQYLPLHGLDVVARMVEKLAARDDLRFTFLGTGPDRAWFEARVRATGADATFVDWIPYDDLGARVAAADIVLGIFGQSEKARMVVPNKVFEAAAVGKAVITVDSAAVREIFHPDRDIRLCEANADALAASVVDLAEHAELRAALGRAAARLMRSRFADEKLAARWSEIVGGGLARLAPSIAAEGAPRLGIAVLHYNDADAAVRCLESLDRCRYPDLRVLVVDNASTSAQRARLEEGMAGRFDARMLWLERNLGYAGGNNVAMRRLFDEGCDYVLVLNADTVVTPDAPGALVLAAREAPGAGPVGPRVARDWPGAPAASLGERFWAATAWLPRSLLRYRVPRHRPYRVGGVLGCAILIERGLFERSGGFDERYFAYYEEVDFCLRAREMGRPPLVEPAAEIAHAGHRGFGGGLTVTAAYLKARNLWLLGRRRASGVVAPVFVVGYAALMATSAAGYLLRGRRDVVSAMNAGWRAARAGETGEPPAWVFGARGRAIESPAEQVSSS